ncbi:putative monovalent cation/H+ antiporter subunit F [Novipirellula galeiformis]|uniref:Putative monovalent cation/H+ antiporter subunit F n=1 Tax=Novipirellula galeiformis TaxID=2528004 RepID=A0A5C6CCI9_9BACT|nr:monovalent cation/H+ antiporter complex subunit F [Novipirellula galeiformis]TWU22513.1 putative monovalent cation/H+ antiporter subunit F [Novipirellula galeiformis]
MTHTLLLLVVVLLASMIAGLVRVVRGPTASDRMLAAQLMGTTGVAVILLLSEATSRPALLDVALVFALLAAVTGIAFVQRYQAMETGE